MIETPTEHPRPLTLLTPFTDFLVALQFLTVMPPLLRRELSGRELGRSVGYYPLVGLLVGALLWGADELLGRILPPLVAAALVLAIWILLTGALHTDGFIDSCDGLLGGFTPEQRLAILKDEHVGAYAVIGAVLLLLVKFAALTTVIARGGLGILLVPTLGRWAITLAMAACPYARKIGLGRDLKDNVTITQVVLATLTALAAAFLIGSWRGLIACAVAALVAAGGAAFTLKRIPGLTGDSYGMINELVEAAVILLLPILVSIPWRLPWGV
ncbi:MAG TPA: adenosylcobinamide-GDP ribazoletransferase [Anaerolineaceae bacterium]|jgi:adenosylcobinamide-GDP ribazoletransferase